MTRLNGRIELIAINLFHMLTILQYSILIGTYKVIRIGVVPLPNLRGPKW